MKKVLATLIFVTMIFIIATPTNILAASKLQKPKLSSATAISSSSIKIKWKKVKGAGGYEIYQKVNKESYKKIKTISRGSTVTYKKSKLKNYTKYSYKIRAFKKSNNKKMYSKFSNIKTVKTKCNHNYKLYSTTKEATCYSEGQCIMKCTSCKHSYSKTLPKSDCAKDDKDCCVNCNEKFATLNNLINNIKYSSDIDEITINLQGELVIKYTDGTEKIVGVVKGKDGANGKDGVDGKDGVNGKDGENGKDGADGYTPIKGTDYWTDEDKNEIVDTVVKEFDKIPNYWVEELEKGAKAINTALCEAGRNKSAFLFYTDVHWNYGSQMSPVLLKYLYEHTGLTKTVFGGDIVNDEGTDYETMKYLWDWRNMVKCLPNHHSVVGNHDDGNGINNLFSEQYVYGYLMAPEETPDIVSDGKGLYYYIDSPSEKTRYLYLDTAYKGVTNDQIEFVKSALIDTLDDWHIVAISHIWYEMDYSANPPVISGLDSGASKLLSMFDDYNSRKGEYTGCNAWVEFCIGGHTHIDYDGVSSTGIPIILCETDSKHVRSGLDFTPGTTTEASVNGIVANYNERKIDIIRIGRGESRQIPITSYPKTDTFG